MEFRSITRDNFSAVAHIYQQGLATQIATFENKVPLWEAWDRNHLSFCRISACENEQMLGWAALSPVSCRSVYKGVAELSVYVAQAARGQGIGTLLLQELIAQSESKGLWMLQSSIFPENRASIKLHEKCGFRKVGYRSKIAIKNGLWKYNVLMERRSTLIGID